MSDLQVNKSGDQLTNKSTIANKTNAARKNERIEIEITFLFEDH